MTAPRLLLLLGQSPFDPTSGAAQSMRQMAELLAARGWAVRGLATSGCEGEAGADHADLLAQAGYAVTRSASFVSPSTTVLQLWSQGLAHEIIVTDARRKHHWEQDVGPVYQAHLDRMRRQFRPQVVLTFGDDPGDIARRETLCRDGARVIFALHNLAYLARRPRHCHAYLAPSRFLAERYRAAWGDAVTVLPPPLMTHGVVADTHDPVFVTFFNPEPAKGLWLLARLAERLGRERPDIPLLVVEGRAPASHVLAAGKAAGVDLSRYANLMFASATPRVADLWAHCRILLAPSVVEEAAGRVVVEAMANGAVPLVSDRGALPEIVAGGGQVLCLPKSYTPRSSAPLNPTVADPWFDAVTRLVDDDEAYERCSRAARITAESYMPARLAPSYDACFRTWLPD
jgi:glycosyltransferase involved in cell wall biosynthesis